MQILLKQTDDEKANRDRAIKLNFRRSLEEYYVPYKDGILFDCGHYISNHELSDDIRAPIERTEKDAVKNSVLFYGIARKLAEKEFKILEKFLKKAMGPSGQNKEAIESGLKPYKEKLESIRNKHAEALKKAERLHLNI